MNKKLQQSRWATFNSKTQTLESLTGIQPVQMHNSAGTAFPLLLDDSKSNKFGADVVRFAAGKGVTLHKHEGAHILLVTKGTGILTYENEKYEMFPGMIYLVPSKVSHAIKAETELVLIAIGNDHQPADSSARLELVEKSNLWASIIQRHGEFTVVRGDLVTGGLKSIILTELLLSGEVPNDEVVYCADPYGHSQIALAVAALKAGKRATFFTTCPDTTPQQIQAMSLNNVKFHVIEKLSHQSELPEIAKKYAEENKAYYMPIGYDFEAFNTRLITFAQSLPVNPTEIWIPVGSGTTFRSLRKAWPNAKICTVNLGVMPTVNLEGANEIYKVPENHKEKAIKLPPYPSNPWYDSKVWQFVSEHASVDALIWNIA